ncbi:hypothetical protein L6267_00835 [Candidatus Parcubacteria bacterium]|nr:hypothetical protein [Candidatus Parcubacteria bacterium]
MPNYENLIKTKLTQSRLSQRAAVNSSKKNSLLNISPAPFRQLFRRIKDALPERCGVSQKNLQTLKFLND